MSETFIRPVHGGYPEAKPEAALVEQNRRLMAEMARMEDRHHRFLQQLARANREIATLRAENANLQNRADNAGHNAEAAWETSACLLAVCEEIHEWCRTDDAAQALPLEPPWYQSLRAALAQCRMPEVTP